MEDLITIFWDNAPHHHALPTFPDHFHNGSVIEPSIQPTIRDVLDFIARQLRDQSQITGV